MEAFKFILFAIFVNIVNSASLKNTNEQNQNKEPFIIVKNYDVEGSAPVTQIVAQSELAQHVMKSVEEETLNADIAEEKKLSNEAKTKPANEVKEESRPLVSADARQNETPNFFEVVYTSLTNSFTVTITSIFTRITEYFGSDNRTIFTKDQSSIQEKLKNLQDTLKKGLSNLQISYDEYITLNKERDMTEEASRQDEEDADKLKNQLSELQKIINDGVGNIDQSLNVVLSADKEIGHGQNSANLDEIIAEFTKCFTQSITGIEKTMQALKGRVPIVEHSAEDPTNNEVQTDIQQSFETLNTSSKADDRLSYKSGAPQDQGELKKTI